MPAKSKHGRGKHHRGKKKSKFRQAQTGAGLSPQVVSSSVTRADAPLNTTPPAKEPVQKRTATSAALPLHYEFISGDLKRIGILTAIVVILLIAAYYIFS